MNVTAVTDRGWWGGALNDSLNRGHARYIPTRYIPTRYIPTRYIQTREMLIQICYPLPNGGFDSYYGGNVSRRPDPK
jgi:hypothetical protein